MKNSKSGFSLVELMVVVAIIGILATIAVPNFQRFQARAKQTSAKTELSGIFTAQKAFYVEYNSYTPDLQLAGFVPEGIVFDSTAGVDDKDVKDINRIYGSTAGVAATRDAPLSTGTLGLSDSDNYSKSYAYPSHKEGCQLAETADEVKKTSNVVTAKNTFIAGAIGCPKGGSSASQGKADQWNISETRQLKNVVNGI